MALRDTHNTSMMMRLWMRPDPSRLHIYNGAPHGSIPPLCALVYGDSGSGVDMPAVADRFKWVLVRV